MADQYGMKNKRVPSSNLTDFFKRINNIIKSENAFSIKDLDINGSTLKDKLDVKQGPIIGIILNELLESVMDDPELNREDKLLVIAENF